MAGLQHDALAEGATLEMVDRGIAYQRLADVVSTAGRRLDLDPRARAEIRRWSRSAASEARDGVPAHAFPATATGQSGSRSGRLRQRDFDLGRGLGLLTVDGPGPAVTAGAEGSGPPASSCPRPRPRSKSRWRSCPDWRPDRPPAVAGNAWAGTPSRAWLAMLRLQRLISARARGSRSSLRPAVLTTSASRW